MRTLSLLLLLSFALPSITITIDDNLETEKFQNYLAAISNNSTFQYFTVIRVKNLNSGEIKEICTQGNFLLGALHTELKAEYDEKGEKKVLKFAKTKRDRYFEFREKKALENISFDDYRIDLIDSISKKYSLDQMISSIKREKKFEIRLKSDNELTALAHILFNNGIMTGENTCFGGTLHYVDRKSKMH